MGSASAEWATDSEAKRAREYNYFSKIQLVGKNIETKQL